MNLRKTVFKTVLLMLFLIQNNLLSSQEIENKELISKSVYAEKIYLQLSSNVFTTDKTIWYKAIVTDGFSHKPTKISGVLRIELIDFDERIIDQKLLKLEKGIADGFFQLNENLKPGRYLIRAYTEWNKNFDQDFISETYIEIYAPKKILEDEEPIRSITLTEKKQKQFELSGKLYPRLIDPKYGGKLMLYLDMDTETDSIEIKRLGGSYSFNYLLPEDIVKVKMELKLGPIKLRNNNFSFVNSYSKTVIVNKGYVDLQFFPEGGKLVNNLTSKVAFKALDYEGKGKFTSGYIIDQYDTIIAPFKTNSLGMGAVLLRADTKKTYYGSIINNEGVEYKYPLPEISQMGYVLAARQIGSRIKIRINSNLRKQDSICLKVQSKGVMFYNRSYQLKDGIINVALEKEALPEGVIKLTVLNENKQTVCERLVFNYREDNRIDISAKTHLSNYAQRDKTIVDLETKDEDNNPFSANLSVLVLNKEQLGNMQNTRQNILSYFLLNSELKGNIEKPAYYFNKDNKNRYYDLDMLMLTQGWRNYKYGESKIPSEFKIKPEKVLAVSGTIGEFVDVKKKKKKPLDLTMVAFGKPQSIFEQQVDSIGGFNFNLGDMYADELEILIQSKNSKGKLRDYTINIDKRKTPKVFYKKEENIRLADSMSNYVRQNMERKQVEEVFQLSSNTITLDVVELTGYKLTPEREKMMALHGPPDVVIESKELQEKVEKWSYGLFSILLFNYPHDVRIRRARDLRKEVRQYFLNDVSGLDDFLVAQANGADFTFIVIDGEPVKIDYYSLISGLPIEEIKSVEIVKHPKNQRQYISQVLSDYRLPLQDAFPISFINIYTYSKSGLIGVRRKPGIYKDIVSCFAPKMEFYAPKYENLLSDDWKIPDLRSVVYWAPNIITNPEGNAQVDFYNADNIGEMLVIVEGITENGEIGYCQTVYTVDEKIEK